MSDRLFRLRRALPCTTDESCAAYHTCQNHLYVETLVTCLENYDKAADKFIDKVNDGQARSVETYTDLKACRAASRRLRGES